jgi:hypothetical protein
MTPLDRTHNLMAETARLEAEVECLRKEAEDAWRHLGLAAAFLLQKDMLREFNDFIREHASDLIEPRGEATEERKDG